MFLKPIAYLIFSFISTMNLGISGTTLLDKDFFSFLGVLSVYTPKLFARNRRCSFKRGKISTTEKLWW